MLLLLLLLFLFLLARPAAAPPQTPSPSFTRRVRSLVFIKPGACPPVTRRLVRAEPPPGSSWVRWSRQHKYSRPLPRLGKWPAPIPRVCRRPCFRGRQPQLTEPEPTNIPSMPVWSGSGSFICEDCEPPLTAIAASYAPLRLSPNPLSALRTAVGKTALPRARASKPLGGESALGQGQSTHHRLPLGRQARAASTD